MVAVRVIGLPYLPGDAGAERTTELALRFVSANGALSVSALAVTV